MGRSLPLRLLLTFALVPLIGPISGCKRDEDLADVPRLRPAEVVAPEKQPVSLRPAKGSSAGMNYDPGGPPP
jgi:hypothetical protein